MPERRLSGPTRPPFPSAKELQPQRARDNEEPHDDEEPHTESLPVVLPAIAETARGQLESRRLKILVTLGWIGFVTTFVLLVLLVLFIRQHLL